MAMSDLKPIPIPWKLRWREFRIKFLPMIICGGALLVIVKLWVDDEFGGRGLTGQVESMLSDVMAPVTGTLEQVTVNRFDEVEAGQFLGQVMVAPPEVLRSSIAVIQAEIELTRLGWFDPVLDQQRNIFDFENLKIDWLSERAALATQKIELDQAKRDYERLARLVGQRMVSQDEYEQARSRVEILQTTVSEMEIMVDGMAQVIERQRVRTGDEGTSINHAIEATMKLHNERLALQEAQMRPVPLFAPIAGTITFIHRRNGGIRSGDPIFTIRSMRAERIVSFVRQPLDWDPQVGMEVYVRPRGGGRGYGTGTILAVGPQIEILEEPFRGPVIGLHEAGLPILVSLPENLNIRPGEMVDLVVR